MYPLLPCVVGDNRGLAGSVFGDGIWDIERDFWYLERLRAWTGNREGASDGDYGIDRGG